MNILVTGGAGYVGSVVAAESLYQGHKVIILDNLQQGHVQAVPKEAAFIQGNICDESLLHDVFSGSKIDAVMHMAAETVVEYSMTDPRRFFANNVVGGMTLLDVMLQYGIDKLIFSSSAAVYGKPENIPIEEDHPQSPINAYGESKLIFERMLNWYEKAYGLKYIALRYFNAAGATEFLGEDHHPETHLIPNVLRAALRGNTPVTMFGNDYPTEDGSCVRDYIHVLDIAKAHLLALERLDKKEGSQVYNLGNGNGYSVVQIIETARKITGVNIQVNVSNRRQGDPPVLVASSARAKTELRWKPESSRLEVIIGSVWEWIKRHPDGYGI